MTMAKIEVAVDQQELNEQLRELIAESARATLIFWDIDEMSRATCLDKAYLAKHILNDHRMKVYERRRGKGKRIWLYEGSVQALKDIVDEWI